MDENGKIVGEARGYDPFSRFGYILLYEIDSFGFCPGYVAKKWALVSEIDLKADRRLSEEFERKEYDKWKRQNILELMGDFGRVCQDNQDNFEKFCKDRYSKRHDNDN